MIDLKEAARTTPELRRLRRQYLCLEQFMKADLAEPEPMVCSVPPDAYQNEPAEPSTKLQLWLAGLCGALFGVGLTILSQQWADALAEMWDVAL